MQPLDILLAAHKICTEILIPKGLSPDHDSTAHALTSQLYAEAMHDAGLGHLTGEQVVEGIIKAREWDMNSPWKGHPTPELVILALKKLGYV